MGVLINMSENLQHAEVLKAHQFLFQDFYFLDTFDFPIENLYDSVLNIIADLCQTAIFSISEMFLRRHEMLALRIRNGTYQFLKTIYA